MYSIKAIPTRYNGTTFRSRLEARWAAFFDLCGWKWDYDPADFDWWTPDFSIKTKFCTVFAEVKPSDTTSFQGKWFEKARANWEKAQVLLLGMSPNYSEPMGIGCLLDPPVGAGYFWADLHDSSKAKSAEALWREAGNRVQWIART